MLPLLLGLAAEYLPPLARWFAGDTAAVVTEKVAAIAQDVTGTTDAAAARTALQKDPAAALVFRQRLAEINGDLEIERERQQTERLKAALVGVADARKQQTTLAQTTGALAWWPCVVDFLVLVGAFVMFALVFLGEMPESGWSRDLALVIIGGLLGLVQAIVGFWRGSSAGSARKDLLPAPGGAASPLVPGTGR